MSNRKFLMDDRKLLENPCYPVVGFEHDMEYRRSEIPFGNPIPYRSTYTINVEEPADREAFETAIMSLFGIETDKESKAPNAPKAKQVILNDPATVVIWQDGTKTVTKAKDGDEYDDKVGLLLCAVRKASNNRIRVEDMEDAIRAVAKLKEPQMRALSAALEVTADNFGEEDE